MSDREELSIDAAIIASVIGRHFQDVLREGDVDEKTVDELGTYAAIAAIPVIRIVLESDDPVATLSEIEALEGMLSE